MAIRPKQNRRPTGDAATSVMVRNLDSLTEFDQFTRDVLPGLRRMIASGASAEEIYRANEARLAARAVTIALTEDNPGAALTAIKEAHDRSKGKATERREITVTEISDADLDKMIKDELKSIQGENTNEDLQN